jgi:hypothetical protein
MTDNRRTIFLITLLALVGANLAQAQGLLASYFFSDRLPDTTLFKLTFSVVWIPLTFLAAWCGFRGAYLALRHDSLKFDSLTIFGLILCPMIRVDHADLGWSIYSLNFFFGLDRFSVGTNFLGFAFLVWLDRLRRKEGRIPRLLKTPQEGPTPTPTSAPPN